MLILKIMVLQNVDDRRNRTLQKVNLVVEQNPSPHSSNNEDPGAIARERSVQRGRAPMTTQSTNRQFAGTRMPIESSNKFGCLLDVCQILTEIDMLFRSILLKRSLMTFKLRDGGAAPFFVSASTLQASLRNPTLLRTSTRSPIKAQARISFQSPGLRPKAVSIHLVRLESDSSLYHP